MGSEVSFDSILKGDRVAVGSIISVLRNDCNDSLGGRFIDRLVVLEPTVGSTSESR